MASHFKAIMELDASYQELEDDKREHPLMSMGIEASYGLSLQYNTNVLPDDTAWLYSYFPDRAINSGKHYGDFNMKEVEPALFADFRGKNAQRHAGLRISTGIVPHSLLHTHKYETNDAGGVIDSRQNIARIVKINRTANVAWFKIQSFYQPLCCLSRKIGIETKNPGLFDLIFCSDPCRMRVMREEWIPVSMSILHECLSSSVVLANTMNDWEGMYVTIDSLIQKAYHVNNHSIMFKCPFDDKQVEKSVIIGTSMMARIIATMLQQTTVGFLGVQRTLQPLDPRLEKRM